MPWALEVVVGDLGQFEPGGFDQGPDGPVEMAASGESPLDRGEPVLSAGHLRVGRAAVFGEVELAAGAQHPDLGQGALGLGDAAQRPGGEHLIHALGVHRQVLPGSGRAVSRP